MALTYRMGYPIHNVEAYLLKAEKMHIFNFELIDSYSCQPIIVSYQIPLIDYDLATSGIHVSFKKRTPFFH